MSKLERELLDKKAELEAAEAAEMNLVEAFCVPILTGSLNPPSPPPTPPSGSPVSSPMANGVNANGVNAHPTPPTSRSADPPAMAPPSSPMRWGRRRLASTRSTATCRTGASSPSARRAGASTASTLGRWESTCDRAIWRCSSSSSTTFPPTCPRRCPTARRLSSPPTALLDGVIDGARDQRVCCSACEAALVTC